MLDEVKFIVTINISFLCALNFSFELCLRAVTQVLLQAHHSAHGMRISALCRSALEPFVV